jgi:predicted dehydrogenase
MSSKVKVGVIGLGVGMAHARGYQNCPDAELIAVCDADPVRLNEQSEKLGISPERQFTEIKDLLALPELDAVSITLPNYLHAPITIAALQAGKHVLCEKPLARSAVEAQSMVDAAKKAGKTLMVCFNYRFREDARWLKALSNEGKLGQVYFAKAGWLRNTGIPGFGSWFTQKEQAGGGPLIDLGVHVLDLTLWLMGYPKVVSVTGCTYAEFGPKGKKSWGKPRGDAQYTVEDLAVGFVRFENGASLSLETSWASHTKAGRDDYFVTLYGSEGGSDLYVPNYADRDTISFYTEDGGVPVNTRPAIVTHGGGHELAAAHFVQSIKEGTPPESTGEQGVALLTLIDALYQSAKTGHEVRFD